MATITPKPLVEGTLLANVAGTLYTVPPATTAVVRSITLCNTDSVDHTVTVHLLPPAGAVGAANMVFNDLPIKAKQTIEEDLVRVLLANAAIVGFADVASKVSIRVDGSEVT